MNPHGPILVPLDGSKNAENAVPVAARIAKMRRLPVRFIHVVDEHLARSKEGMDDARELFAAYAGDLAARYSVDLGEGGIEFGVGDPARVILHTAESCSEIVIATHGRGGFRAAFIGSVADKVIRGAQQPIIAVPGTSRIEDFGEGPVLIAVDGSESSARALSAGREFATQASLGVVLVRAFSAPPPVGVEFAYYPPDFNATLEQAAFDYLEEVAQPGERKVVINGNAASAIVQVAKELKAAIVVIASSGKSLPKRFAMGSTTDRVLHSLRRPMLIVPPPESEA
ncbi:MAG: universal stress protein [Dehalococcoidia bacterium]|nr:universal stress protein [Dehalococcoidia bacterium]